MSDAPINHEEAEQLASLKRDDSNLARCYLDLQAQLAQAREQADYHRNLIELQGDEIKRQATELQQAREQVERHATDYNTLRDRYDGLVEDMNNAAQKIAVAHVTEQQLRERLAGAMEWVPIAEADLKYNENILVLHEDGKWNDCEYRGGGFCKFHDGEEVFNVTHICRVKPITPPPSNPAERDV